MRFFLRDRAFYFITVLVVQFFEIIERTIISADFSNCKFRDVLIHSFTSFLLG
nr:MAG TPA: hypothetical protein [Caudoviricetes sp.]DAX03526.1 MAG TPA: hypothetical protein [Bacteriophage sp.]